MHPIRMPVLSANGRIQRAEFAGGDEITKSNPKAWRPADEQQSLEAGHLPFRPSALR
jgi:hypothetical protein